MAQLNPKEMQQALALPFAPEDLEWRLQNTIEEKMCGLAVPYVTNRAIQNRLDEVCGPENWYNDFKPWHSNGKKEAQLCGIAIYFEGRGLRHSIAADTENPAGADSTGGKRACSKSAAKAGKFPVHACIGSAKSRPAYDTERFTADSVRTAKQSGGFPHSPLYPAAERSAAENRLLCGSKHQGTGRYERQQHACYAPSAGRQADPGLRPRRTARTERRQHPQQCKAHCASAGYRGILCVGILRDRPAGGQGGINSDSAKNGKEQFFEKDQAVSNHQPDAFGLQVL